MTLVAALRAGTAVVAIALLASCGAVASPGSTGNQVVATDSDNGKAIQLRVGDQLQVKLSSTYWTINESSDTSVLKLASPLERSPQPSGCVPGAGCGLAIASFNAVAAGSADVTASRISCGEAMRCVGNAGSYRVSVVVSP